MNEILLVTCWSVFNCCVVILKNELMKSFNSDDLFIFQTLISVILITLSFIYKPITSYTSTFKTIIKNNKIHFLLWIMTIFYVMFSIINNYMLSYKDVSRMVILSNIIYLLMITIVTSYLENIPITINKVFALLLLSIALYILNYK